MRKAKIATRASGLGIGLFLAVFAIASCGGKLADDSVEGSSDGSDASAGNDSSTNRTPTTPFDAGAIAPFDGGEPAMPPVDHGPQDTDPACASRASFDCSCHGEDCPTTPEFYFGQLVQECAAVGYVCDDVYVDFDPEGCAIDLRAVAYDDAFVACIDENLDSERWNCMDTGKAGTIRSYVDCTTR